MGVKVSTRGNPVEPVHLNNLMVGIRGWGTQTGLGVAEKAAGANMSVDVAIGTATVSFSAVTKSTTTNVLISAAHASFDRYDLVTMTYTGSITVQAGTAAATSYANDYDLVANNAILLAEVLVPATDTTIEDAQITDYRNVLQGLADITNGHDHDGTDSKTIVIFVTTEAFSASTPTSWTDLDLSSIVGSNQAVCLLKVKDDSTGESIAARRNGDTDEYFLDPEKSTGVSMSRVPDGTSTYILVVTDSSGIIEIKGTANNPVIITMEAYWI